MSTDTERLDFLLQFMRVEDVGDEHFCPGVVVDQEGLEERVGFGPMIDGKAKALAALGDDMRTVIDRAIEAWKCTKCAGGGIVRKGLKAKRCPDCGGTGRRK